MRMCRVTTTAGKSTPKLLATTPFETFIRLAFGMIISKMFTSTTYWLCSIERYVMIAGTFTTWHTARSKDRTRAWNFIEISFVLFVSVQGEKRKSYRHVLKVNFFSVIFRDETRTLIVFPDRFLFKLINLNLIKKETRRWEHEYVDMPPKLMF